MPNFGIYNVNYSKSEYNNQLVVRGEITNQSGRNYSTIAVRIVLFVKSFPVANTIVVVNDIPNGATKSFEKYMEELEYEKVFEDITRYEVVVDSAY